MQRCLLDCSRRGGKRMEGAAVCLLWWRQEQIRVQQGAWHGREEKKMLLLLTLCVHQWRERELMLPTLWPFVHRWRENTLAGCVGSVRLFPAATLSRWGCAFCVLACYCSHSSRCRIPHSISGEYERGSGNSQTLSSAHLAHQDSSSDCWLRRERNEGEVG